eukprot:CAMPEP_0168543444 /NCGR_PEP_ID=MMETSP0413-20121227/1885_1 /TAXON_ID=136452 /ORGANISM="Filamoeba nolandi, Strain NC-AS-23-1" /LENGTH=295 /DNA_ID=CAMNT_0008573389 /DNA_START=457 /DNA_END=1344 /DNA_ORIENTATION=-
MTTLLSTLVLAHIANAAGIYSGYTTYYAAWWGLYQALTLQVLQNTQRFFHDSVEAKAGIQAALFYSPAVVAIYLGVEYYNQRKFEFKKKDFEKSRKEIDSIPTEFKSVLQSAGVKPQALMDPEFVGFLKGTIEDIVKAQNAPQPAAQASKPAPSQPVQAEPVTAKPAQVPPPAAPPVPPPVAPAPPAAYNPDLPPPVSMEGAPLPLGELPPPPALSLPAPKPQPPASIDALLESIRKGKSLKKVDTNAPRPAAKSAASSSTTDIGSLLHKALEQRRAHLEEVEPETEDNSADEWN